MLKFSYPLAISPHLVFSSLLNRLNSFRFRHPSSDSSFSYHLCHAKDIPQSALHKQVNTPQASTPNTVDDIHLFQIEQSRYQTEEKILDEIEPISKELDELEKTGQIDSPTKFALTGHLGTIIYGVVQTQISWFFWPDFYFFANRLIGNDENSWLGKVFDSALKSGEGINDLAWINAMLRGIFDAALSGLAIGTLLGYQITFRRIYLNFHWMSWLLRVWPL